MFFAIDPNNGVAIYEQIVRQMSFAIAAKTLKVGELVPSVRQLAHELTVNPNTVSRAYRDLQTRQVLESVRGLGLVVAKGAVSRCREERLSVVRTRIRQVLKEARQSHLDEATLRKIIDEELTKSLASSGP